MNSDAREPKQEHAGVNTYLPIEDYGIIGDLHTVALVGRNGSIDWCCIPSFDSPSVFGALLDAGRGGFFRIAPHNSAALEREQYYLPETNILVTRFVTSGGVGEVTDFMPIEPSMTSTKRHRIMRSVHVVRGSLSLELTCRPAFNYGRDAHSVQLTDDGAAFLGADLDLGLFSSVPLHNDGDGGVHASFDLQEGQQAHFVLASMGKPGMLPERHSADDYQQALLETKVYWRTWLRQCRYQGRWREMVHRSALVLKLLTYAPTGAIVAAPTTSLPEAIGGQRNWDYRYTWLRDSALTLHSLLLLGFTQEAEEFGQWLLARLGESGEDHGPLPPMYTINGERDMPESVLDHLEGYRQSRPVRIGNGAYTQQQLDVYGELLDAISIFQRGRGIYYDGWRHVLRLLNWLSQHWQTPDEGIWEVRGGKREFVHSRLMCWVAFDRAIRIAQDQGLPAPIEEWRGTRNVIYAEIMTKGWSEKLHSFVQYYGTDAVDASALLISLTRFTAETDPRLTQTIDRIQHELTQQPHVYRYRVGVAADDGFTDHEGAFSICSFWLIEALCRAGRLEEARQNLDQMLTYANHLGLYAEEIGPTGEALGNFPQAFTHLALISACHALDEALGQAP